MKKSKIAIVIVFMLLVCGASIYTALYFSSSFLIKHFHFTDLIPTASLPFSFAAVGTKGIKSFSKVLIGFSFAIPLFVCGGILYGVLMPKKRGLHGDAKFASKMELTASGLLQPDKPDDKYPSILVGKYNDQFMLFRGQEFMFLAAPTRSGKGVGIVIPNLLHYRDSVVVLDVKGENFQITSGFRASCGQDVHKFAPDDENNETAGWNPMDYVRDHENYRVSDLMRITTILYPPNDDSPWSSTAESLFLGLALYIMDTPTEKENFNIATIKRYAVSLAFLKDEETFMLEVAKRKELDPLSTDCIFHLKSYAQTSDKVRNSIAISFNQPLAIFSDPITAKATRKSTFDMRDVRKRRMSIYVVIKPSNIDRFGKFLNLFFQQLLLSNMDVLPQDDPSLKYQCLLLLDEFTAMGRVAIIEKASAYMAGYNMRLLLIFQSKSQVKDRKLYDETGAQTMLTNMALQVCFAPRDDNDAKEYSEMIGFMTEKGVSKSRQLTGKAGRSESESDQRRAVLLPQEVKAIGKEMAIVSMENIPPALVSKIFWYKESVFNARANMPVAVVPKQGEEIGNVIMQSAAPTDIYTGLVLSNAFASGAKYEVGFSPKRNALEVVMSLILEAKSEILVAAYSFTSSQIANGLVEARKRGVAVFVVVDEAQNDVEQGGYNAVSFLIGSGIEVLKNSSYAAMHHKFMVVDRSAVQLGSFNYTASAHTRNAETAFVLRNVPDIAAIYTNEWIALKADTLQSKKVDVGSKKIDMGIGLGSALASLN